MLFENQLVEVAVAVAAGQTVAATSGAYRETHQETCSGMGVVVVVVAVVVLRQPLEAGLGAVGGACGELPFGM